MLVVLQSPSSKSCHTLRCHALTFATTRTRPSPNMRRSAFTPDPLRRFFSKKWGHGPTRLPGSCGSEAMCGVHESRLDDNMPAQGTTRSWGAAPLVSSYGAKRVAQARPRHRALNARSTACLREEGRAIALMRVRSWPIKNIIRDTTRKIAWATI